MSREILKEIEQEVKANKVLLYMKGTPDQPQCGFSFKVIQILSEIGKPFAYVNILADEEKRQGIKEFASWPTIPQLYVGGEFVGGCDIVTEMHENKELEQLMQETLAETAQ